MTTQDSSTAGLRSADRGAVAENAARAVAVTRQKPLPPWARVAATTQQPRPLVQSRYRCREHEGQVVNAQGRGCPRCPVPGSNKSRRKQKARVGGWDGGSL